MSINTFKIETLEALKKQEQNPFMKDMWEAAIRDELRGAGLGVNLDRMAPAPEAKEAKEIAQAPVAQIEAPKEEPKIETAPEVKAEEPAVVAEEVKAEEQLPLPVVEEPKSE